MIIMMVIVMMMMMMMMMMMIIIMVMMVVVVMIMIKGVAVPENQRYTYEFLLLFYFIIKQCKSGTK